MKKVMLVLMLAFAVVAFAGQYDKWLDEDGKVLATKQEKDAFKKLKTDADKEQFINQFWAKRDPSPGTPENEYKSTYEQNVQKVNEMAKAKNKPGSYTDLGMTLLLLGKPDDQKKEEAKAPTPGLGDDEEEPTAGPKQKMSFIYKKLSPEIASGEVEIPFVADAGEWKFADKKKAEEVMEKARDRAIKMAQSAQAETQQKPAQPVAPPPAAEAVMAPITTAALKTALDAAAAGNAPKDLPVESLVDVFMTSADEPFFAIAIHAAADMAAAKVGIRVLDPSGAVVKEWELPFVSPSEPAGHFQTSIPINAAGDYTVLLAIASGEKTGASKQTVNMPDQSGFAMSSVILSTKFNQLTEAKPEKEAYTFGKIKVQPSVDHVFEKAQDMIIVYEIYNFQTDAATAKPNLEVTVGFQAEKAPKPQTTPPQPPNGLVTGKKMTIPTSFPLGAFPAGKYKLIVTLTDKVSGSTTTRETSFTVK